MHHARLCSTLLAIAALAAAVGCSDERQKSQVAPPPPPPITINRIDPTGGATAGGTTVTIIGGKFIDGVNQVNSVTFGGVAGTALNVLSASQLTVDTPAGTGAVNVVVTNTVTSESATAVNGYTYYNGTPPAPGVTGVSPSAGATTGGYTITISGSGFVPGMTVTIGGNAATGVNVLTGGLATVIVPAATGGPGAANVSVNNGGGTTVLNNGFVYTGSSGNPAPSLSPPLNPNSGTILGGTLVTINGANFISTGTAKPTVQFGTGTASNVTVIHAGQLTCVTPSGPNGAVTVTVINPDLQSVALGTAYTYITPSPNITGISPASGPQTLAHAVTITGTNFFPGVTVDFGGTPATLIQTPLLTQLVVQTPTTLGSGSVTVTVTNTAGSPPTATTSYTFNAPPTYSSINPSSGSTAGGTPFTITGGNFLGTPFVSFGGQFAAVSSVTGTTIIGTTPGHAGGTVNVIVTNPDGQSVTATGVFTYVPSPSITSIVPSIGPTAGGGTITINGGNFQSGATVTWGAATPTVTFVNSTRLTITLPSSGTTGPINVTVTNPTGAPNNTVTLNNGFTYSNNPTVTSVSTSASPAAVDTAGNNPGTTTACSITIVGTTFLSGATVAIRNGMPSGPLIQCTGVVITGGTQIVCTAPSSGLQNTGAMDVVVTNPGGLADSTPHQSINVVYDTNFQTRQFVWDTSTGIDCRRRWYIDFSSGTFLKDMQNRGLQTWGTPGDTSAPPGTLSLTDQYARDWQRAYVLATLNVTYGRNSDGTKNSGTSINVTFVGLPPAGGTAGSCASPSTDYSRHAVGGCNPSEGGTTHPKASQTGTGCNGATVGTAAYDSGTPCGNSAENNCNSAYHSPCSSTTRGTFSAGIGNIWGGSVGGGRITASDLQYLDGTTTSGTRYNQIHTTLQQFAHRIAFVTSHECGHSLGLVANTTGTGSCSSGSGQCGSTGSHNNCCTTNIMRSIVTLSGTLNSTSFTFSTGGSCASPSSMNSWAMLGSFLGISP